MAPARPADLPQGTPFDAAVIALLYVWVALNATLTVWIETDLAPVASAAGVWAGAGLLFWWTHRGRLALLEFDSGLNVRDRFFVFLAVIGFAAAPALFWDRASAPVVLLALNPPLVVLACKRVHFHRLFCVNLLLTVFVVRALPGFPLALMALEALIVFLLFAADAMAGRAEPGFVAPGQVAAFTIRPALG